jgi:hypothetical protein
VTWSATAKGEPEATSSSPAAVDTRYCPDSSTALTTPSTKFEVPMKSAKKCETGLL